MHIPINRANKSMAHSLIFLCVFSLFSVSCGNKNTEQNEPVVQPEQPSKTNSAKVELPEAGSVSGDTINIYGRYVVFYERTDKSANQTTQNPVTVSFKEQVSGIIDSLNTKTNISAVHTTAGQIRIFNKSTGKPMIILTSSFNERQGMIMTDGHQLPTIKKGLLEAKEYQKLISAYFLRPS